LLLPTRNRLNFQVSSLLYILNKSTFNRRKLVYQIVCEELANAFSEISSIVVKRDQTDATASNHFSGHSKYAMKFRGMASQERLDLRKTQLHRIPKGAVRWQENQHDTSNSTSRSEIL
jgi:hypothetical protein